MDNFKHRLLRAQEVCERIGVSRTTLWRKVRDGNFPQPVRLGENSVGWFSHEIADWEQSLPRVSYDPASVEGAT